MSLSTTHIHTYIHIAHISAVFCMPYSYTDEKATNLTLVLESDFFFFPSKVLPNILSAVRCLESCRRVLLSRKFSLSDLKHGRETGIDQESVGDLLVICWKSVITCKNQ